MQGHLQQLSKNLFKGAEHAGVFVALWPNIWHDLSSVLSDSKQKASQPEATPTNI